MIRLRSIHSVMLTFTIATLSASALAWPRLPHRAAHAVPDDKPLRLRHIAGVVVDKKGLVIPYPAVELRDGNDHHLIATSFADGNGRFHFEDRKPGETLQLAFSVKGYQTVQYSITIARIGHETMKAVMPSAQ